MTRISVWLDETSEPGESTWIVSRDRIGADGGAETTTTLSTHDDREEAVAEANEQGEKLGLPVVVE